MGGTVPPIEDFMPVEGPQAPEDTEPLSDDQMAEKLNFVMRQAGGRQAAG